MPPFVLSLAPQMEKPLASSLAGLKLGPHQKHNEESDEEPMPSAKLEGPGPAANTDQERTSEQHRDVSTCSGLKIQLLSDLHIEMDKNGKWPELPVTAPVLALLGDVGLVVKKGYGSFIRSLAINYETVLVLAGNHEFYGGEYEECKYKIRSLAASVPNVHFLDCSSITLGGVKILGCTLWSHVPSFAAAAVAVEIRDYDRIKMQGANEEAPSKLTVAETNSLHRRDVVFLEKEIAAAKAKDETVLVLTHHAPLMRGTSAPEYERNGRELNHAFCTDLSHLMGPPVAAWAYGHTHYNPGGLEVNGTQVLANQKVYNSEKKKLGVDFDPGLVLHVKGPMETSVERSV